MSVDIMTAIKQQAATLTVQEKLQLANYLLELHHHTHFFY
jgi:hypothetical protein